MYKYVTQYQLMPSKKPARSTPRSVMLLAQLPFRQRECQQFVSIEGPILHGVVQYVSNEF
jgi:hypothetical protein